MARSFLIKFLSIEYQEHIILFFGAALLLLQFLNSLVVFSVDQESIAKGPSPESQPIPIVSSMIGFLMPRTLQLNQAPSSLNSSIGRAIGLLKLLIKPPKYSILQIDQNC